MLNLLIFVIVVYALRVAHIVHELYTAGRVVLTDEQIKQVCKLYQARKEEVGYVADHHWSDILKRTQFRDYWATGFNCFPLSLDDMTGYWELESCEFNSKIKFGLYVIERLIVNHILYRLTRIEVKDTKLFLTNKEAREISK